MTRKIAILSIVALITVLFVYASVTKLTDFSNFRFGLSESPFISSFAGILAWMIPLSELFIVVLLVLPATRLAGFYLSFALMLSFTIYIAVMLLSGSEIPCSCGGVLEELSWPMHIVFNSVFVVLSAAGIWLERKNRSTTALSFHSRNLIYAKRHSTKTGTN